MERARRDGRMEGWVEVEEATPVKEIYRVSPDDGQ
jgi:hypothetical protein